MFVLKHLKHVVFTVWASPLQHVVFTMLAVSMEMVAFAKHTPEFETQGSKENLKASLTNFILVSCQNEVISTMGEIQYSVQVSSISCLLFYLR